MEKNQSNQTYGEKSFADQQAKLLLQYIRIRRTSDTPHYENVPFEIPEGWSWCRLDELFLFIRNGKSIKQVKGAEGFPITRIETISNSVIDRERMGYANITDTKGLEEYILRNGDILMSHINSPIHVGKSALCCDISEDEIILHGMNLLCLRPHSGIDSFYLDMYFNSPMFRDLIRPHIKNAVNQASINTQNIGNTYIPVPPLAEQIRISNMYKSVNTYLTDLTLSLEGLTSYISSAKSKILDLAIHGKLVPQDPNDEPASVLLKRINPKAITSCDNPHYENTPYNIPQSWCWQSLKSISSQISTKEHQIPTKEVEQSGLIPVVSQSAQIIDGYSNDSGRRVTDIPIILFGDHTRVVKYLDFEFVVGADGTKLIKSHIFDKYLYYWVKATAGHIRDRGYGRHFALLNQEPVPIPPLLEQKRIVARIDELFLLLDLIEKSLQA